MSKQHILAIPFPAQGHVIPLMELSQCLANLGFEVTFVNTEHNHKRVMNALADESHISRDHIHLVSIPDGLEPLEDRNELGRLSEAMQRVMPGKLEELIEKINQGEGQKITCVIVDQTAGWILEVAEKMKIRRVAFCPAAAAVLALILSIPKLIHEGIINNDGEILLPLTCQVHNCGSKFPPKEYSPKISLSSSPPLSPCKIEQIRGPHPGGVGQGPSDA
ncbi:hypothetical protein L3X38_020106 [Prunus dulcis]|uniref:Glycosyltransferase N-terminal domain-containing protein n=1 Tax=Prunus dulcis TaxID=3755 RepID=A0AAD4WEW4_PRUDU|nr:hypothetical protein L3X38_020106 [Prunus dulcis]